MIVAVCESPPLVQITTVNCYNEPLISCLWVGYSFNILLDSGTLSDTCKLNGDGTPVSNFPDYAGPLTETILLGNLAVWAGTDDAVEWDADGMVALGVPMELKDSVEKMVRHEYLNGYEVHEMAGTKK